jgi:predicted CopG family antitoxin
MGRKRKINDGVILTIYLPRDLYMALLDMAYRERKSVSEYIRERLHSLINPQMKVMNGGSIVDLEGVKKDLILEEAWEKLENLKKIIGKLEGAAPSIRNTLKYYELKQTARRLALELIDYINRNGINEEKLLSEASNMLRKLNGKWK